MTAARDVDAVYARLFPKLVGAVSLYCGDRWVAEEIAQETLSRLWERSRSTTIESPDSWAYRVAMNLATSWFRRRAVERRARSRRTEAPDDGFDVEQAIVTRRAVAALPTRQRQVVILRYFADLSVEETAAVLQCAPGTVKTHAHRALRELQTADLGMEELATDA